MEFIAIRDKFLEEVQADIDFVWNNRKKLIMDVNVLSKWYPENWQNMTSLQLFGHFNKAFCSDMRFVKDRGNYFEQLLTSKVFGGKLRKGIDYVVTESKNHELQ